MIGFIEAHVNMGKSPASLEVFFKKVPIGKVYKRKCKYIKKYIVLRCFNDKLLWSESDLAATLENRLRSSQRSFLICTYNE